MAADDETSNQDPSHGSRYYTLLWNELDSLTTDAIDRAVVDVDDPGGQIDSLAVYWSLDGNLPYTIEPMMEQDDGSYGGFIPAQPSGTTVYYFIYAATESGFYQTSPNGAPLNMHSYYVGTDTEPPSISEITTITSSINNSG